MVVLALLGAATVRPPQPGPIAPTSEERCEEVALRRQQQLEVSAELPLACPQTVRVNPKGGFVEPSSHLLVLELEFQVFLVLSCPAVLCVICACVSHWDCVVL